MRVYVWTRDFELHEINETDVAARFMRWATSNPARLHDCLMRFVIAPHDEGGMGAVYIEAIEDMHHVADVVREWVTCLATHMSEDTS